VKVTLIEISPVWYGVGHGITLQGNALKVFNLIGAFEKMAEKGHGFDWLEMYHASGAQVAKMPAAKTGGPELPATMGALRSDIQTVLVDMIHELGVEVISDVDDALAWADVANVLRVQHERMDRAFFPSIREYHRRYGITMERLNRLDRIPLILHPGPINRGVELTSEVADSPHAAILNQVENGVAVRMAVLYLLAAQSSTQDVL
ncbi:MAG: hypothetical protein RL276_1433, partial [Bacteroidota bacterium]